MNGVERTKSVMCIKKKKKLKSIQSQKSYLFLSSVGCIHLFPSPVNI